MKGTAQRDPFRTLVSAVISTRTQDRTTAAAAARLFRRAGTPAELARLEPAEIEKLIYPVGFYHTKAKLLPGLARALLEQRRGRVPHAMAGLLELPGVGRKVANIVLANAFDKPAIAVDTHVFRISYRLGLAGGSRPEVTERELERVLPRSAWCDWNYLLVVLGQAVCRPLSPCCSACPVARYCARRGVNRSR